MATRFVSTAGLVVALTLVYMLLIVGMVLSESTAYALRLGLVAGMSGAVIGGALFYLVRRFLPVRWYTRIPCALLSGLLSFVPFSWAMGGISAGSDTGEVLVAISYLLLVAPVPVTVGIVFGAGAGQMDRR